MTMLHHHLTIAWRHLRRQKGYTFINLVGLATGMAACLLMLLYVRHELSYDRFHEKADQVYRVIYTRDAQEGTKSFAPVQYPVAEYLMNEFPQVIQAARFYRAGTVMGYEGQHYQEPDFVFTESSAFDLFDFTFVQGSPETAFQHLNGIILTEAMAQKYFGDADPVGQLLTSDNWAGETTLEVTAVVEDVALRSHFKFDFLVNFALLENMLGGETWDEWYSGNWVWTNSWTYLLLNDDQAEAGLQRVFPDFVQRHYPENTRNGIVLSLQPLTDIYLHSQLSSEMQANGSLVAVYTFSAIAFLVLLIACINFINLATARSAKRAKEVGLRKVLGALRPVLVGQFLGEALLLSLTAVFLALVLVVLALPHFNGLMDKTLSLNPTKLGLGMVLGAWIGIGLFTGLVAGLYPAFVLSAFRPVPALKGISNRPGRRISVRHLLVVGQFVASIMLLISIAVMYQQQRFMRDKDLGYVQDHVVVIRAQGRANDQYEVIRDALHQHPQVQGVTRGGGNMAGAGVDSYRFFAEGHAPDDARFIAVMGAHYDFLDVMGINLVEGRFFSEDFQADTEEAYVLNEATVAELGWQGEALGKRLDGIIGGRRRAGQVIGVVQDFHLESLHHKIQPLVLRQGGGSLFIKIGPGNTAGTLAFLEETWEQFIPEAPFEYGFVDEDVAALYAQEERLGRLIHAFTLLAILVACLGLFGLASFMAEQRTKEIGIRKTLGAPVGSIVMLLSQTYARLVLVAFVLAAPLGYIAMDRWLQQFAYRIEVGWLPLVLSGVVALVVALTTVSYQSLRAALAAPIKALRYE